MNTLRRFSIAMSCAAVFAAFTPAARADAWDKRTIVTFSDKVEVPGTVLEPGKYVMKLVDSPSDRHIVTFTNERENHVFATVNAIPAYRERPAERTIFTFYEAPAGQPQAMRTWFYPGDNFGQEFVYTKGRTLLALNTGSTSFESRPTPPADTVKPAEPVNPAPAELPAPPVSSNESVTEPQPAPAAAPEEPTIIAQAQATQPPAPAAPPASDDSDKTLPKTAGNFAEIVLAGLASLSGAGMVRKLRRTQ